VSVARGGAGGGGFLTTRPPTRLAGGIGITNRVFPFCPAVSIGCDNTVGGRCLIVPEGYLADASTFDCASPRRFVP